MSNSNPVQLGSSCIELEHWDAEREQIIWIPPDPLPPLRTVVGALSSSVTKKLRSSPDRTSTENSIYLDGEERTDELKPISDILMSPSRRPSSVSPSAGSPCGSPTHERAAAEFSLTSDDEQLEVEMAIRAISFGRQRTVRHWLQHIGKRSSKLAAKDSYQGTALHYAAWFNKPMATELLLKYEADPNVETDYRTTPLHVASYRGNMEVAEGLMRCGADVHAKVSCGWTAMHFATQQRSFEMIQLLIDNNADPDVKIDNDVTPLHLAAEWGKKDLVQSLLQNGLKPNTEAEYNGLTPLHLACERNNWEIVKILLKLGANPNVWTSYTGVTPLHIACKNGDLEILNLLLRYDADLQSKDSKGFSPAHYAVTNNQANVLRRLISDWKLSPNLRGDDVNHTSLLHVACESDHPEVINVLLKSGANPDIRDGLKHTPMHFAAKEGHAGHVSILLDAGADIDSLSTLKETPLHLACEHGHLTMVEQLVEQGFDINALNEDRRTPLHKASANGHHTVIEFLLDKYANVSIRDKEGFNCLDIAIESEQQQAALAIVNGKQWRDAMRNTRPDHAQASGKDTTPFRRMIIKMPEVAEVVMNRCIITNSTPSGLIADKVHTDSLNFRVTFNYEFIEDCYDPNFDSDSNWGPKGYSKDDHPLNIMVNDPHAKNLLLKHPLVDSLIVYKWSKYARMYFMGNLLLYILYLMFLTTYCLIIPTPLHEFCQCVKNETCFDAMIGNGSLNCTPVLSKTAYTYARTAGLIVFCFSLIRLLIELIQIIRLRWRYFLDWVNWIEWTLYILSIVFVLPLEDERCLCSKNYEWQLGAFSLFLAWIIFTLFLQSWYLTGVYILMFRTILNTFTKIIFLLVLLVVGFALPFYMLFYDPTRSQFQRSPFSSIQRSLISVLTMSTGEFDFNSQFRQSPDLSMFHDIWFPYTTFLLWVLFLVLMPILLDNLLVGLAVGDVKEIQEKAKLWRTVLQVQLILGIDAVFPARMRSKVTRLEKDMLPNRYTFETRDVTIIQAVKSFFHSLWKNEGKTAAEEIESYSNTNTLSLDTTDMLKKQTHTIEKSIEDHHKWLKSELKLQDHQLQRCLLEQVEHKAYTQSELESHKEQLIEIWQQNKAIMDALRKQAEQGRENAKLIQQLIAAQSSH